MSLIRPETHIPAKTAGRSTPATLTSNQVKCPAAVRKMTDVEIPNVNRNARVERIVAASSREYSRAIAGPPMELTMLDAPDAMPAKVPVVRVRRTCTPRPITMTAARTATPMNASRARAEATPRRYTPMNAPGILPARIHPTLLKSMAPRSRHAIEIVKGSATRSWGAGARLGLRRDKTGTAIIIMPRPTAP